jgi:superfamily II DNA/RNA helicase
MKQKVNILAFSSTLIKTMFCTNSFPLFTGPYAVVMAPTRELAQQIEEETVKFAQYLVFDSSTLSSIDVVLGNINCVNFHL